MATVPKTRTGQAPAMLQREKFSERFEASFRSPAFDGQRDAIARLAEIAWGEYRDGNKAPRPARPAKVLPTRVTNCRSNGVRLAIACVQPSGFTGIRARAGECC